jgi:hypothetical protein
VGGRELLRQELAQVRQRTVDYDLLEHLGKERGSISKNNAIWCAAIITVAAKSPVAGAWAEWRLPGDATGESIASFRSKKRSERRKSSGQQSTRQQWQEI